MIPVKVCGITNMDDAHFVAGNGVSAIGFIFHEKSPRYIDPKLAFDIIASMNEDITFVGVFVDKSLNFVNSISREIGLDFVQLHGDEKPKYCDKVNLPVIKVFKIGDFFNVKILNDYDVHAFLFDTYDKNLDGGTGRRFDWSLISRLNLECPIILSGGLNEMNVNDAIRVVLPNAVDINSGIEKQPGIKHRDKISSLFKKINDGSGLIDPFKKIMKKEF